MQASFGYRPRKDAQFVYDSSQPDANAGASCCLPRQQCVERKSWVKIGDPKIPFVVLDGMLVALGNANFRDETFRVCSFNTSKSTDRACP